MFCKKKRCSEKCDKIYRKTATSESPFNNEYKVNKFIKRITQHRRFLLNFVEFFRILFLIEHLSATCSNALSTLFQKSGRIFPSA